MTDSQRVQQWFGAVLMVCALTPRVASAQANTAAAPSKTPQANTQAQGNVAPPPQGKVVPPKTYDEIYEKYLASARGLAVAPGTWMADLATDPNARRLNDLVTIRVIESISASGSADSNINKASSGNIKLPLPKDWWDLTMGRITPFTAETKFNGSGETSRTTELSATMTARVIEVLPNGDLVVQGVRELDIKRRPQSGGAVRRHSCDGRDARQRRAVHAHRSIAHQCAQPGIDQGQPHARLPDSLLNKIF
jgi:flagellar basal body L-ring protein FlgH